MYFSNDFFVLFIEVSGHQAGFVPLTTFIPSQNSGRNTETQRTFKDPNALSLKMATLDQHVRDMCNKYLSITSIYYRVPVMETHVTLLHVE